MSGKLKEVRTRISSVKSTQQITSAMKLVAASKLRRAQNAITDMRPYAQKLTEMLSNIVAASEGDVNIALAESRDVEKVMFVCITSDRGLCGAFNANICKSILRRIDEKYQAQFAAGNVSVLCIGKKGGDFFRRREGIQVVEDHEGLFKDLSFENCSLAADWLMDNYALGEFDVVEVAYAQFKNAVQQNFLCVQTMPIKKPKAKTESKTKTDFIFEPGQQVLLEQLVPKIIRTQLFSFVLDNHASEHGARMTAMDSATENAEEMLRTLKLAYNKARQAAITTEISEIAAGADALKGA